MERAIVKSSAFLFFIIVVTATIYAINGIRTLEISFDFSHAEKKHLSDAEIVRRACENSLLLSMKIEEEDKIVKWCKIDPETIGIQVVKKIRGIWQEITAYKISQTTIEKVLLNEDLDRFDYITFITDEVKTILIKIGYLK
jgi:hypothetical protein